MIPDLVAVAAAFGLGEVLDAEFLPVGTMNRNWRVVTTRGVYAVKQLLDVSVERARLQYPLMTRLAVAGLPVPRPLVALDGESCVPVADGHYLVCEFAPGGHRNGDELSSAECLGFGRLLGALHTELAAAHPPVPALVTARVRDHADALAEVDRFAALIAARSELDDFDRNALRRLAEQRELIERWGHRPPPAKLGPGGWTHGDFHQNNVLWDAGRVSAVLDWDRLQIAPRGAEVARAAELTFWIDGALDLNRVAAFVAGYREAAPITSEQLADGFRLRWWNKLCGTWPLDTRYDRGDHTCDHFFEVGAATRSWWCVHQDEVIAAATAR